MAGSQSNRHSTKGKRNEEGKGKEVMDQLLLRQLIRHQVCLPLDVLSVAVGRGQKVLSFGFVVLRLSIYPPI